MKKMQTQLLMFKKSSCLKILLIFCGLCFVFVFKVYSFQVDSVISRDSNVRWLKDPKSIYNLLRGKGISVNTDIVYDTPKRCKLDLLLPKDYQKLPSVPVVMIFHGGGFVKGDRFKGAARFSREVGRFLANDIAVALVDYPLMDRYKTDMNTLQCITQAARSVQFIRHNAKKYNINSNKIIALGSSAGAGITLFLATNELKDSVAENKMYRESSRIAVAGLFDTQMGYNFFDWEKYFKIKMKYSPKIVAQMRFHYKLKNINSNEALVLREKLAFQEQLTKNFTPPLFLSCSTDESVPLDPNKVGQMIHHVMHSNVLYIKATEQKIKCQLVIKKKRCANVKLPIDFVNFALNNLKGNSKIKNKK
ncbi:alpha/beta hydrolase [Lentisphaerota bacterium WC36G]|nr:alpha/beta hydrolase [Lentisphaerae bacterium WC36]